MRQYTLPLPHENLMGSDDFMVTDSNREAWQWLVETNPRQWPSHAAIVFGATGCGKSHLLNIWLTQHQAKLLQPTDDLATILSGDALPAAYALDNADKIAGNPDLEIWLQHLYNVTKEAGRPLLLAAQLPPKDWGLRLADIKSRLCSILAIMVKEPDDALLEALIMKLFADRQLRVDHMAIDYMISHLPRRAGLVRDFIGSLDSRALAEKRNLTTPFIRDNLDEFLQRDLHDYSKHTTSQINSGSV